ncbi:RidA family protein [Polynucleobacter rarus]|uniref:RidA family protein n=1 Tax=Polynucleobacter rarus TaxID=556055 RepID=UPI001FEB0746|nr:RidA family protein [Polynucleobacter rarus]
MKKIMVDTHSQISKRLENLGIVLTKPSAPAASYVMSTHVGNLVYLSGHIAKKDGIPWVGKLGRELTTDEGKLAARSVAIDLLATLEKHLGDLDSVQRIIKVSSFVNCTPEFTEHHLVTNGCSELLVEVFGDAGKHARSAVGVNQLPMGVCVEIELIAEISKQ